MCFISTFLLWFTQLTHFYKYLTTFFTYFTSSRKMHLQYYEILVSIIFKQLFYEHQYGFLNSHFL